MRRYYPTRHTSYLSSAANGRTALTHPTQNSVPWWQSPVILGAILLGVGILGVTLLIDFTTQRVIHIRADDSSDSAVSYAAQRLQHCQASSQQYKPGDTAITIPFADRAVTTHNISIFNSLSLIGQCKDISRPINNKQPGTALIGALERIQSVVQKERARNNFNPVVVSITIQDAEPGFSQSQLDMERVKALVHTLTSDRGAIAFMVEDEKLQSQLDEKLTSEGKVQVCSLNDVTNCVNKAFETGRKL